MTPLDGRWALESIAVTDILGFQGTRTFNFSPGLQVIEAPNHSGKSSLVMALLWALTGEIPTLPRLDNRSYALTNKHAGSNASPAVQVTLTSAAGETMEVDRKYLGRTRGGRNSTVDLRRGERDSSNADADDEILEALGVRADTLQGCGVVLQDLRLRLIQGSETDISSAINDMLGLEALSDVVPLLEKRATEAGQLEREISRYLKDRDPVRLWKEEEDRLMEGLDRREHDAHLAGFNQSQMENARELFYAELSAVAAELGVPAPRLSAPSVRDADRLRRSIADQRKTLPERREHTDLDNRRRACTGMSADLRRAVEEWGKHAADLRREAEAGEMVESRLATSLVEAEAHLARLERERNELAAKQGLVSTAYAYVLQNPALSVCPVCGGAVHGASLAEQLVNRLNEDVARDIEHVANEKARWKAASEQIEARQRTVQSLSDRHEQIVRRLLDLLLGADQLTATLSALDSMTVTSTPLLQAVALFTSEDARAELINNLTDRATQFDAAASEIEAAQQELDEQITRREDMFFQPLDERLNKACEVVLPLAEAEVEVNAHGELRDRAEEQSDDLHKVQADAQALSDALKRISAVLSEEELRHATESVNSRAAWVSDFFARVAQNPDFTGLEIKPDITRNRVRYQMRATSSKMAALGDAVGHVLSEGDLSAAGMALLLGLASGDQHHLGFLLLDDPAEGMDPTIQSNFARELAKLPHEQQIIILTHQPEFADRMEESGAVRTHLGRWADGRNDEA